MSSKLTSQFGSGSPSQTPVSSHCSVGLPVRASFRMSTFALYVSRLLRLQYLSPRLKAHRSSLERRCHSPFLDVDRLSQSLGRKEERTEVDRFGCGVLAA